MTTVKLTTQEIEENAYIIAKFMTLSSIESELEDAYYTKENEQTTYSGIDDVIAVLEKANEVAS